MKKNKHKKKQKGQIMTRSKIFSRKGIFISAVFFSIIGVATMVFGLARMSSQVFEAETFQFAQAKVVPSGSTLARMFWNGSGIKTVSLMQNSSKIAVDAYGTQCQGAPQMVVKVDGTFVMNQSVAATSLKKYESTITVAPGSHTITISFTNDYLQRAKKGVKACDRNLYIDKLTFTSNVATQPTPVSLPTSAEFAQLLANDMSLASEVVPHGATAPWAYHPRVGAGNDPGGFTGLTAWGQLYECLAGNPQPNARVELRDINAWVKSKATGRWTRVQQSTQAGGGWYQESFATNASNSAGAVTLPDGGTSVTAGKGYVYHFYPSSRAVINPNDIGGYITTFRARLIAGTYSTAIASPCYTLSAGADYWRNSSAQFKSDYSNNYDIGIGRFKRVDDNWRLFTVSTNYSGGALPTPAVLSTSELR